MVEEAQLLGAMGGIVGRMQIDGDASSPTLQSTAMTFDHALGQGLAETKQLFAISTIFKARQGRLRSQILTLDGVATDQQFVYRIGTQPGRIVGIRIPTRDRHDSLGKEFA